jgi:hypothetical protein
MPLTYSDRANIAVKSEFIARVKIAMVSAAIDIASEDPATANHADRVALSLKVLHNPLGYAELLAVGIAQRTSDPENDSDATIQTTVASIWDAYSG